MPTDRTDLERRLAAATADDTVRGLIFNAIFDAVEEHLGKDAAVAIDPTRKAHRTDFFSFPVSDYLRLAFDAVDRLEPRLGSVDAGFHAIGYRAASNTFGSMVGATLLALSGKDGARTLLSNAAAGYKATVSYGQRRLEWLGPAHARFTFTRDFLVPPFHCGVFQASVEAMGAKDVKVVGRQIAPLDAVYEISWKA
ncbi:DUF2378 family protein [Anaeromyxobacter oryzae]|uniref:DUF2378 family protein n=1 Tax=Anaeromyxobacter oryzae TaxID=2918170 RepID=A0ABN6MUY4_9BACT|nr:DUF2378 family protein [Anaeromyxobacter oryzae]BDG04060.1 hypothetical protein AMOR_30560 [Anaeromyxobacter oryzae]